MNSLFHLQEDKCDNSFLTELHRFALKSGVSCFADVMEHKYRAVVFVNGQCDSSVRKN